MRLLGLALLTLLIMGGIQVLLMKDRETSDLASLLNSDRAVVDLGSDTRGGQCSPVGAGTKHSFHVRESDTWGALVGAPGYQKASFALPRDVRVESGVLHLDLASHLQTEGIARLRVNVNGQRRGEFILGEGQTSQTVRVNLLPSDLSQSVLNVALQAAGKFPEMSCSGSWGGGIVVRVEPSSRVELVTAGPLTTLDDRLRATGNPVQISWPSEGSDVAQMVRLMRFSVGQHAVGVQNQFQNADAVCSDAVTMTSADLAKAEDALRPLPAIADLHWPLYPTQVADLGQAKHFAEQTTWRIPYDLRETPGAEVPTKFDLDMSVAGMRPDASWMLSVMLNGRAIHTERLQGDAYRIRRTMTLPADQQGFGNELEVKLINSDPANNSMDCDAGLPVLAQLEPGTRLYAGVAAADPLPAKFVSSLPDSMRLQVGGAFTAAEATAAAPFLADVFGEQIAWVTEAEYAAGKVETTEITRLIMRRDATEEVARMLEIARAEGQGLWMIWPRIAGDMGATFGLMPVRSVEDVVAVQAEDGARIAALVTLPAETHRPLAALRLPLETGPAAPMHIMPASVEPTPTQEGPALRAALVSTRPDVSPWAQAEVARRDAEGDAPAPIVTAKAPTIKTDVTGIEVVSFIAPEVVPARPEDTSPRPVLRPVASHIAPPAEVAPDAPLEAVASPAPMFELSETPAPKLINGRVASVIFRMGTE